jgi:SAM-dependent methyltransferase
MSDWTSGYVAEIDYLYGCYQELNPLRARLAFLNVGLEYPEFGTACELGFGQGLSVNMHAAGSLTKWRGTDFNPMHASFAQALAAASGAGAELRDEGFAQFCARPDLPDFDYIGLHGVWSWISDENRTVIADFLRRKLKVGGVLYISYNTLPAWAAMVPFRHLLTEHAETMSAPGQGIASRVNAAMGFMDSLLEVGSSYGNSHPQAVARLKSMKGQSRSYLAHEYFNRDWKPMHFSEMADWLAPAKLTFACSAHFPDHVDFLNLSAAQLGFLAGIPDPRFRESVRDFLVNRQFRKDYWVKGARRFSRPEQMETVRNFRVILTKPRSEITLTAQGSAGDLILPEATYGPVLQAMEDCKIWTLGEIEAKTKQNSVSFAQVMQIVMVLIGKGAASPAQDKAVIAKAKAQTNRLNAHLLDKARTSENVGYLASPVTGGAIPIGRVEQLFLLALARGVPASGWAAFVSDIFLRQGEGLKKDGETLDAAGLSRELTERAETFATVSLPVLKGLMIA